MGMGSEVVEKVKRLANERSKIQIRHINNERTQCWTFLADDQLFWTYTSLDAIFMGGRAIDEVQ